MFRDPAQPSGGCATKKKLIYPQLVNVVHNAIVMHGTFVGIGSPDARLSPELEVEGQKVCERSRRSPY